MAKNSAVWGIDIGQCALKAVRCSLSDDGETVVADAFDYIEYPKLLTQAEADPEELIREALQQFLSRNPTKGDKVAVSVSGQSGLARFIKLPPVEVKKIPDIVKYEAKQQIPFKLEEVIWDYQQLPGTIVEEGFAMESEVGLFAMKREQVFRAVAPYQHAGIELDIVQLAPICIYNAVSFDMLGEVEDYDPENPPEYVVVLSIGTETTDLVITNGYRVWQRSIPLGGNHFTKQLTKELKLTFAKAEHLKRNARQAEDPKSIFQAMRPVFNDLEKEVRRSLNFFRNNDRSAKLGKLVLLGNTTRLPGLPQYLEKSLGMEVLKPEAFNKLEGGDVVDSPAFKENVLSFPVCYGLALQGLGKGHLATNLVPREILTARLIKEKKPWAVATLAVLLLGLMLNFAFHYLAWATVKKDREVSGVTWAIATSAVEQVNSTFNQHKSTDDKLKQDLALVEAIGEEVIGNSDGRLLWTELLRAINAALPIDPGPDGQGLAPGETPDPKEYPFNERPTLYITAIESQYFPDLKTWFSDPVKQRYLENARAGEGMEPDAPPAAPAEGENGEAAATDGDVAAEPAPEPPAEAAAGTPAEVTGPEGAGWVIELQGYHYFNDERTREMEGSKHLRNTLIRSLEEGSVQLPTGPGKPSMVWTMKELGIQFPIIAQDWRIERDNTIPNPAAQPTADGTGYGSYGGETDGATPGGFGAPRAAGRGFGPAAPSTRRGPEKRKTDAPEEPKAFPAPRYRFIVQFAWQEQKLSERLEARRQKEREAAEAARAAAGMAAEQAPAGDPDAAPPDAVNPNGAPGPEPRAPAGPQGPAPRVPIAPPDGAAGAPPAGPNGGPPAAGADPGAAPPAGPPNVGPPNAGPPNAGGPPVNPGGPPANPAGGAPPENGAGPPGPGAGNPPGPANPPAPGNNPPGPAGAPPG